jgi:hypothetical protein
MGSLLVAPHGLLAVDRVSHAGRATMPKTIGFADVKNYLDAIADKNKDEGRGDIADSPHFRFWEKDYQSFITADVDNLGIPIINRTDPVKSMFFVLLTTPGGNGGFKQMPDGGPYVTDTGYELTIGGTTVKGKEIADNLRIWLQNNYPEFPKTL